MTHASFGFIAHSAPTRDEGAREPADAVDVRSAGGWGFNAHLRTNDGEIAVDAAHLGLGNFIIRDDALRLARGVTCGRDYVAAHDGARLARAFVVDGASEAMTWRDMPVSAAAVVELHINDDDWAFARDESGTVWTFDLNDATSASARELRVPARATKIAVGSKHAIILTEDGEAYGIGWNLYGTLGLGHVEDVVEPTLIASLRRAEIDVVDACCGQNFTILLSRSGDLYACGSNALGALGQGSLAAMSSASSPTLIEHPMNVEFRSVRCSSVHVVAVASDGDLYLWGSNAYGACGVDERTTPLVFAPTRLSAIPRHGALASVVVGRWHVSCAWSDR